MALADELRPGSGDFAQRFLQTAVVVDDEAYMPLAGAIGQRRDWWHLTGARGHRAGIVRPQLIAVRYTP